MDREVGILQFAALQFSPVLRDRILPGVSGEILALPIYPESTTEQREYVVDTIAKFFA